MYPFFKVADMNSEGNERSLVNSVNYIDEATREVLRANVFIPGTIVFPKVGGAISTNKKRRIVVPSCVDNNVMGLTPRSELIDADYLEWWLQGIDIYEFSNKANPPSITQTTVKEWPIALPPLEEQQRIVAVLDEALEGLARARAHAEANLQNARELFGSYLNSVFEKSGPSWTTSTLGETCTFVGGSQPPKSVFEPVPGAGLVRLIQIRDYKTDEKAVYIPHELAKRFCTADDVMIGRYGPPLFQILRGLDGAYNVALMKAIPNEEMISRDFLFFFLRNRRILDYVERASSRAAGQSGINKATLEPYPISYPAQSEQDQLVMRLTEAEEQCNAAVEKYEAKIADLVELRQSLLQKAFAGELT